MKEIIYTCDVCGLVFPEESVSTMTVTLNSIGKMEAEICHECMASKKSYERLMKAIVDKGRFSFIPNTHIEDKTEEPAFMDEEDLRGYYDE